MITTAVITAELPVITLESSPCLLKKFARAKLYGRTVAGLGVDLLRVPARGPGTTRFAFPSLPPSLCSEPPSRKYWHFPFELGFSNESDLLVNTMRLFSGPLSQKRLAFFLSMNSFGALPF